MEPIKPVERVRVSGYGVGGVTLSGLTPSEIESVQGVCANHHWMTVDEGGRMQFVATRQELPGPAEDDEMLPFWRRATGTKLPKIKIRNKAHRFDNESPSISIQHLCGYYYTPSAYATEAKKLESWGFQCMRSRRGEDGRFWENWYLPGLWAARGALKQVLAHCSGQHEQAERARGFLCRHASFGSMDMMVQRAAMDID